MFNIHTKDKYSVKNHPPLSLCSVHHMWQYRPQWEMHTTVKNNNSGRTIIGVSTIGYSSCNFFLRWRVLFCSWSHSFNIGTSLFFQNVKIFFIIRPQLRSCLSVLISADMESGAPSTIEIRSASMWVLRISESALKILVHDLVILGQFITISNGIT